MHPGAPRRTERSRGRGPQAPGARAVQPRDRRTARRLTANGRAPCPEHLRKDRPVQPCRGCPVRDGTRAAGVRGREMGRSTDAPPPGGDHADGMQAPGSDRLFTPAFVALTLSELAYFSAAGLIIGVTPFFVTGPLGSDEAALGLVAAAFSITTLLLRPFAGRLADRRGRRPLLVGGALLCAIAILRPPDGDGPCDPRRAAAAARRRRGVLLRGRIRGAGRSRSSRPDRRGAQL